MDSAGITICPILQKWKQKFKQVTQLICQGLLTSAYFFIPPMVLQEVNQTLSLLLLLLLYLVGISRYFLRPHQLGRVIGKQQNKIPISPWEWLTNTLLGSFKYLGASMLLEFFVSSANLTESLCFPSRSSLHI